MRTGIITLLLILPTLGWAQMKPLAITDIGVMQLNSDGTYSVVCMNGNRETVTDLDLKLGNVCPNQTESEPSNILSMQRRDDGDFDVVCRDFSNLVATAEEIMNGDVCGPQEPEYWLEDGAYTVESGYTGYCDQRIRANYEDNVLTSLRVDFTSPCSAHRNMTCENGVCKADRYTIRVMENSKYRFDNGSDKAVFKRK